VENLHSLAQGLALIRCGRSANSIKVVARKAK